MTTHDYNNDDPLGILDKKPKKAVNDPLGILTPEVKKKPFSESLPPLIGSLLTGGQAGSSNVPLERKSITNIGAQAGVLAPKDNLKGVQKLDRDLNNYFDNYQAVKVTKMPINVGGDFYEKKPIPKIDINDNAAIGELVSQVNNADYLEGASKGQKQEFIKALNTRALFNTAKSGITPTINQLGKEINQAVVSNIIEADRGEDKPSNAKDDAQRINHFKWGLSHIEKTDPARFNNVIATISQKKKVPESDFYALSTIGQDIENAVKTKSAVVNKDWEKAITELDYTTFGQKKAQLSGLIGEELKKKGYGNQAEYTEEQIREGAKLVEKNRGIKVNPEALKELVADEKILFYDAIPKGKWMDDVAAGIMKPLGGIKSTFQTLGESPAETYLRSQKLDEGIGGQKVPDEKGQYSDILPSEREDWKTGAFRGGGEMLTNIVLSGGIGGIGKKALGSTLSAAQKSNLVNYLGTGFSTYLQTYGQEYEDALRRTGNPEKAKLIAAIDSGFTAGWEMLLPDVKIARESFDGVKRALGDQLESVISKGGSPQQMTREAKPFIDRAVKNIASIWGKEISEEVGTTFTDYMTETIFSPKTAKERNLGKELTETLKEAAKASSIPAIVGGGASSLQTVVDEETERDKLVQTAKEAAKDLGEMYRIGFEENPEAALKEVAQQLNASEGEAKAARRIYGDKISDAALELFPDEKVETSAAMQELLSQPKEEDIVHEEKIITPEGEATPISESNVEGVEKNPFPESQMQDPVYRANTGGKFSQNDGRGTYFTTNKDYAELYAWDAKSGERAEGVTVDPYFLDLKKPLRITTKGPKGDAIRANYDKAIAEGHDGIIASDPDSPNVNEILAFNDNQIKKIKANETSPIQEATKGVEQVTPSQEATTTEQIKEPPIPPTEGEAAGEASDESGLSGIRKALVSDEIIKGVDLERIPDKEMMSLGRKILDTGEIKPKELVTKIVTEGKGVLTPTEVVGLITYKRDVDNKLTDTYKQINEKREAGEDLGTLGVEAADLERQQHDFDVMAVITAQQQSMAFRLRQRMLDRDYNVVTQIEKYKKNNNGYIPEEVEAKFKELGKQLDEVKAKLAEAEKKAAEKDGEEAVDNIKESVDREQVFTEEEIEQKVKEGVQKEIDAIYDKLPKEKRSLADKAIKALENVQKKLRGGTYSDASGIVAIIDAGITTIKNAIKAGVAIVDAVDIGIKKIKELMVKKGIKDFNEDQFRKDAIEGFEAEGVSSKKAKDKPTINEDGTVYIPNQMIRDLVSKGVTDINDLADAVHKEVVKDLPDITKRQVRDYITDYGKTVNPTADDIQQQVNTAKRVGRLLSELEDLQNKKAKTKNPEARNKITEKEREIKRKIRVLEEAAGITETVEEKNIKRLEKRLDDLLSGNVSNTKEARELSEAEKDLNDKIAEAKKNLGLIKSKNVKTDTSLGLEDLEAKEQRKIKILERELDELRAGIVKQRAEKTEDSDEVKDLKEQIFEEKRKLGLIKPKTTQSTPNQLKITETEKKIERLEKEKSNLEAGIVKQKNVSNEKPSPAQQEKIDNLNDEIFDLKKNLGLIRSKEIKVEKILSDEERLELSKKRVKDRIAELERKIKNKDFAKPVKKLPVTDSELVELNKQKEKLEEEFDNEQFKIELKNRTWWKKAEDVAVELSSGVVRGLVASVDLSAGLVQGMYRLFTDMWKSGVQLATFRKLTPNRSLNAFKDMFKSLVSKKYSEDYLAKLKSSPIYPMLQASKLAIDDKSGHVSAKEGLFISNWVNLLYDKVVAPSLAVPISIFTKGDVRKAYNIAKAINPYLASQRAFDGYVNSVRVGSFVDMAKSLEKDGYNFEADSEQFKKAADFVNTTTGRGTLGSADPASKWLNIVFFAPRKVISEVKMFSPYAFFYYAKMPAPVRKRALKNLGTFLLSFTTVNALIWAASKPDEDDEEDMKIWNDFWNPNSSNFLTHKIGGKRVSVGGGAKSMINFLSRLFTGKYVDQYGNETQLGDRFGKQINTRFDLITNYIAGKTSPAFNVAIQKFQERKGLELDNADVVKDLTVPIWMQDLKNMYKDDPASVNAILTALSIFGANVRTTDESRSPFTDEDKKDPTFKYFLDKGMNLPNVVTASIDVPDAETKTVKNLTEFPEEKIEQYKNKHKEYLKEKLAEVKDNGFVYIDEYGSISTDYDSPPEGYDEIEISKLTKQQLAKILKAAQVAATNKTKGELFPK